DRVSQRQLRRSTTLYQTPETSLIGDELPGQRQATEDISIDGRHGWSLVNRQAADDLGADARVDRRHAAAHGEGQARGELDLEDAAAGRVQARALRAGRVVGAVAKADLAVEAGVERVRVAEREELQLGGRAALEERRIR